MQIIFDTSAIEEIKHMDLHCFKTLVDENKRYNRGFEAIGNIIGL